MTLWVQSGSLHQGAVAADPCGASLGGAPWLHLASKVRETFPGWSCPCAFRMAYADFTETRSHSVPSMEQKPLTGSS